MHAAFLRAQNGQKFKAPSLHGATTLEQGGGPRRQGEALATLVLCCSYNLDARQMGALHIPDTMRERLCAVYDCDVTRDPGEGSERR